uniref:Uncharacterized protein n=1 Tax=Anopheles atroparvus TaxID=41427 RepID=A0A182JID2_ANOAO
MMLLELEMVRMEIVRVRVGARLGNVLVRQRFRLVGKLHLQWGRMAVHSDTGASTTSPGRVQLHALHLIGQLLVLVAVAGQMLVLAPVRVVLRIPTVDGIRLVLLTVLLLLLLRLMIGIVIVAISVPIGVSRPTGGWAMIGCGATGERVCEVDRRLSSALVVVNVGPKRSNKRKPYLAVMCMRRPSMSEEFCALLAKKPSYTTKLFICGIFFESPAEVSSAQPETKTIQN